MTAVMNALTRLWALAKEYTEAFEGVDARLDDHVFSLERRIYEIERRLESVERHKRSSD